MKPKVSCEHYDRLCTIKFACCEEFWTCHRCHNSTSKCGQKNLKAWDLECIKCNRCGKVQEFPEKRPYCIECNLKFSEYFCPICKHLTGTNNKPYHCKDCGICRVNKDISFHCNTCGYCINLSLKENHKCRPNSAHDTCFICLEPKVSCEHYDRFCTIKFACCEEFWACHRCHNSTSKCGQKNLKACDLECIKCNRCGKVQEFPEERPYCIECNLKFSEYFCPICKHLTGTNNKPYHCKDCGICRVNKDISFHCNTCGYCMDLSLKENHKCRPNSAHDTCFICLEPKVSCDHYDRFCTIKFACCEEFWACHRCHNSTSKCGQKNLKARDLERIKCNRCGKVQEFPEERPHCIECNLKFSDYFCPICKHLTGTNNKPYHCKDCGTCRVSKDNSFHCDICGYCMDLSLKDNHKCRPNSAHDSCFICLEDSFSGCQILPCSHKVHEDCARTMLRRGITRCPVCRESFADKMNRRPSCK